MSPVTPNQTTQEVPLAHLGEEGSQDLASHLRGVSKRSSTLARKLGLPISGELLGLLHDLGKATQVFQAYLCSFDPASGLVPQHHLRGKIDHSTAGAQCLLHNIPAAGHEHGLPGLVARVLGLCIASHHSGLIDCLLPEGQDALNGRLNREDKSTRFSEAWRTLDPAVRARALALMQDPALLHECQQAMAQILKSHRTSGDRSVQLGLLVRCLFSCLIDADRTDTADFEKPRSAVHRQNQTFEPWYRLQELFDRYFGTLPTAGDVNQRRAEVSAACLAAANRPPGIYTLTVPTGGGKTLAALRFALQHAHLRMGGPLPPVERILFISPYISIVDQNAAVARSVLEPKDVPYASVVLEHHSDLVRERDGGGDIDSWRRRVLSENWDAPVVFTTMVQVLDSLFGAGTRSVRRLHTLANAVIIFDEVQTLPVKLVHLFNNAINLLAAHCGSTVLLCTATQPLLAKVDPSKGAAALGPGAEVISDVKTLFGGLRRYKVFDRTGRDGGWTQDVVADLVIDEAVTCGSCLAVVNTKRDAREIFARCSDRLGSQALLIHLSTAMVPAHRTEALGALRNALAAQENVNAQGLQASPVVCISTQLIEAGVDIDFAAVVRDLAGLDSITQAAGRCNRHGRRPHLGRVHIVELPMDASVLKKLPDIQKGQEVARRVLGEWRRAHTEESFPLDAPETVQRYFDLAFYGRKQEMSYNLSADQAGRTTTMLDLLGSNTTAVNEAARTGRNLERNILLQSFATAGKAFEVIGGTQGVVVPFGTRGQEIVNALNASRDLEAEWQLLKQAQPYTLSLYDSQFRELERKGAVYETSGAGGVYCLRPEFYDRVYGLRPEAGPLEELIA